MPDLKKLVCLKIGPKEDAYTIHSATSLYRKLKQEIDFDGLEVRFNAVPDRNFGVRGPPIKEMLNFVEQARSEFDTLYLHGSSYLIISLANERLDEDFPHLFDNVIVHRSAYEDMTTQNAHWEVEKFRKKLGRKKIWKRWIAPLMSTDDSEYSGVESLLENEPYLDSNMHQIHREALRRRCNKTYDVGHHMKSFYLPTERHPQSFSDSMDLYSRRIENGWPVFNMEYIRELAENIVHCHIHGLDVDSMRDHIPFEKSSIATPAHKELIHRILANAKNLQSFTVELSQAYHDTSSIARSMEYFEEEFCKRQP